jgi:circadian clock protein KaiC
LLEMHHAVEVQNPDIVVVDPISNLMAVGTPADVRSMLTRVIDFFKTRGVTAMFTSLTTLERPLEPTESMISSLMDTWLLVDAETENGVRGRTLAILKSRGMPHSDEVRAFRFGSRGVELLPATHKAAARPRIARKARGKK